MQSFYFIMASDVRERGRKLDQEEKQWNLSLHIYVYICC
jgi:hypothetical protein